MRIHLVRGKGNGKDQACLMSASNILIGRAEDGDDNHCVCPLIRRFAMHTNDAMPDHLRDKLYGPLIKVILGTVTDDPRVIQARAELFTDFILREMLTTIAWAHSNDWLVSQLRSLPALTRDKTLLISLAVRRLLVRRDGVGYPSLNKYLQIALGSLEHGTGFDTAAAASAAAHETVQALNSLSSAYAPTRRVVYFHHTYTPQSTAELNKRIKVDLQQGVDDNWRLKQARLEAASEEVWRKCAELIRKVSAIGKKQPIATVITEEQLASMLSPAYTATPSPSFTLAT